MKSKYIIITMASFFFFFLISCSKGKNKKEDMSEEKYNQLKNSLTEVNRLIVEKNSDRIKSFARRNNWDIKETETGLCYMFVKEKQNGLKSQKGMIAEIKYKISLLDGTLCYSSDSTGIKKFEIGKGEEIKGLEEGVLLMKEGEIARFIIPSYLGYGFIGDNNCIPPNSIIIYEVELINLIPE